MEIESKTFTSSTEAVDILDEMAAIFRSPSETAPQGEAGTIYIIYDDWVHDEEPSILVHLPEGKPPVVIGCKEAAKYLDGPCDYLIADRKRITPHGQNNRVMRYDYVSRE